MYLGQRRSEMPPHLFAIADQAYRNMIHGTMLIVYVSVEEKIFFFLFLLLDFLLTLKLDTILCCDK